MLLFAFSSGRSDVISSIVYRLQSYLAKNVNIVSVTRSYYDNNLKIPDVPSARI